jgi:hypothetical protein
MKKWRIDQSGKATNKLISKLKGCWNNNRRKKELNFTIPLLQKKNLKIKLNNKKEQIN